MVHREYNKLSITVQPAVWILAAIAFLTVPVRWLLSWVAATVVHELFHYIALFFCRQPVHQIEITANGTIMHTGPLSAKAEAMCAAAGPIGSACMIGVVRYFPLTACIAVFQCFYNLVPVWPMDGGRIVKTALDHFCSPAASDRCMLYLKRTVLTIGVLLGIYGFAAASLGLMPLVFVGIFAVRTKFPCKEGRLWYNSSIPTKRG